MARNVHSSPATVRPLDAQHFVLPWQQTVPEKSPHVTAQNDSGADIADPMSSRGARPEPSPTPMKLRLRDRVERLLRAHNIPYVNVDEARRALFASAKLRSFHFVAYMQPGANWLIFAAAANRQVREGMAEWERVFGEGFIAVLASAYNGSDAEVRFHTLDCRPLTLDAPAAQPIKTARSQGGGKC